MEPITPGSAEQPDPHKQTIYNFGEFELDLHVWELRRNGRATTLSRKSMHVLAYLLQRPDRTVSREELLGALWPATRVATGSLTQAIWEVRQVLSLQANGAHMIATVRGRGYRFVAEVTTHTRVCSVDLADEMPTTGLLPEPLQARLRMLPRETRSVVLELATLLAQRLTSAQIALGLMKTARTPVGVLNPTRPPRS